MLSSLREEMFQNGRNNIKIDQDQYTCNVEETSPNFPIVKSVRGYGYPLEVYENVETEDKYLLSVYRIPHGISNQSIKNRPVVLMLHGFMASAWDYLLMGPGRALAYVLAEAGYDVWLGNYRGTDFSRKHKELDSAVDIEYWNFSFHEIGVYDLPAMINLTKKITGCKRLSYIGTSQGTTSMFVLLSEKPHYNDIIKIFICLAPICNVTNMYSPFVNYLAHHPVVWQPLALALGWFTFPTFPMTKLLRYLASNFCRPRSFIQWTMVQLIFYLFGHSTCLDEKEVSLICSKILYPASVKHYVHFSQNAIVDEFRKYDFGAERNLKEYNQETPPLYELNKVTSPVAVFHSHGDWISGQKDLENLKEKLPNVVLDHLINHPKFNHLDFCLGTGVENVLYKHVQKILDDYNKD